jgi:site-specific recombinase XerD
MGTDAVNPLRQRMIEDVSARKLNPHTQRSHINGCKRFAAYLKRSPDTATSDEIRLFQLHRIETGASICNRNRIMTGLRFLFRVTLRRLDLAAEIYHIKEPQKIPLVMSPDEAKRLLAMAGSLKVQVLLALSYGAGLRAGEVVRVRVGEYRQHAEHHPHRAVQRAQRPPCHAFTRDARSAAAMVEGATHSL